MCDFIINKPQMYPTGGANIKNCFVFSKLCYQIFFITLSVNFLFVGFFELFCNVIPRDFALSFCLICAESS